MSYEHIKLPEGGEKITIQDDKLNVPNNPILGFVEGDGIGPDITNASLRVWDAAVNKAYGGDRKVHWCELYMGEKAAGVYGGDYFPSETLDAIKDLVVAIKGFTQSGYNIGLMYSTKQSIIKDHYTVTLSMSPIPNGGFMFEVHQDDILVIEHAKFNDNLNYLLSMGTKSLAEILRVKPQQQLITFAEWQANQKKSLEN